jgi:hypothetical protein
MQSDLWQSDHGESGVLSAVRANPHAAGRTRQYRASFGGVDGRTHGKARIRQVFDQIDEDHDGYLSREELRHMLDLLGVYLRWRLSPEQPPPPLCRPHGTDM